MRTAHAECAKRPSASPPRRRSRAHFAAMQTHGFAAENRPRIRRIPTAIQLARRRVTNRLCRALRYLSSSLAAAQRGRRWQSVVLFCFPVCLRRLSTRLVGAHARTSPHAHTRVDPNLADAVRRLAAARWTHSHISRSYCTPSLGHACAARRETPSHAAAEWRFAVAHGCRQTHSLAQRQRPSRSSHQML